MFVNVEFAEADEAPSVVNTTTSIMMPSAMGLLPFDRLVDPIVCAVRGRISGNVNWRSRMINTVARYREVVDDRKETEIPEPSVHLIHSFLRISLGRR
jgi:hypothetical protein